jgi:hypothetical protein
MATGRISAGNNLTIDMSADRWRLLVNGDSAERVLLEAATGEPLRYMPTFGQRRRLPDTGLLPTLYIQRVVLGWSVKDEAWHLGLLLEPELAEARGSRWCEVAHWPDPERDLYADVATQAGRELAQTVARPFDLIPPRTGDSAPVASAAMSAAAAPVYAPAYTPAAPVAPPVPQPAYRPPVPLPSLPITLDDWQLQQVEADTLEFKRSGGWARGKIIRAFWYLLLVVIYLVLSITTLQGYIALPKPEFLPYLGLASAAILFILAIATVVRVGRTPNRYIVKAGQGVTALRGNGERWHVPAAEIDSVYASQVVGRKIRRDKRTVHYGELSLLQRDGKFRFLLDNDQVEEKPISVDENTPAAEGVTPLNSTDVESSMQTAAAHVARVLGLPAWYDQRLK